MINTISFNKFIEFCQSLINFMIYEEKIV